MRGISPLVETTMRRGLMPTSSGSASLRTEAMTRETHYRERSAMPSAARASHQTTWYRVPANPKSASVDTPEHRARRAIARARRRTGKESAGSRRLDYRRFVDLSVFPHDAFIDQLLVVHAK